MKTVNRICQVLAIVFGVASLALFFFDFATLMISGQAYTFSGAQLAFDIYARSKTQLGVEVRRHPCSTE